MSTSLSSRQQSGGRAPAVHHSFLTDPASPHTDLREVNVVASWGLKEQMFISLKIILPFAVENPETTEYCCSSVTK